MPRKRKARGRKPKAPAKPYDHLDDTQRGDLFGDYLDLDGDIDKVYAHRKKRVPKKILLALEEDFDWVVLYQKVKHKWVKKAIDQAVARKDANLTMIHNAKLRAYHAILGETNEAGDYVILPASAKSLGEAVEALGTLIEKETELLGDVPTEEKETPEVGVLRMVLDRFKSQRKGGGDDKNDTATRADALGIRAKVGPQQN